MKPVHELLTLEHNYLVILSAGMVQFIDTQRVNVAHVAVSWQENGYSVYHKCKGTNYETASVKSSQKNSQPCQE